MMHSGARCLAASGLNGVDHWAVPTYLLSCHPAIMVDWMVGRMGGLTPSAIMMDGQSQDVPLLSNLITLLDPIAGSIIL